ncbi:hypothetical protein CF319_g537 [Tilletia indica]|nr:hypothetical protein CF319_g537 [Tilletia indica]
MSDIPTSQLPPASQPQQAGGSTAASADTASMMAGFKRSMKQLETIRANRGDDGGERSLDVEDPVGEDEEGEQVDAGAGSRYKGKERQVSPHPSQQEVEEDDFEEDDTPATPPKKSRPEQVRAIQLNEFAALFDDMTPKTKQAAISRALDINAAMNEEGDEHDEVLDQVNPYRKLKKQPPVVDKPRREVEDSLKRDRSPQEIQSIKRARMQSEILHRSDSEPLIMRGAPFKPGAKSGASVDMPSLVILNKLRNSMYVPLWHLTQEGIAVGRARDAHVVYSTTAALSKLFDTMGANAQLDSPRKEDWALSFLEMSSAHKTLFKVFDKIIAEASGEVKQWLTMEKEGWQAAWKTVKDNEFSDRESSWPYMAMYIDKLRHDYYDTAYGGRPDINEWQEPIWKRAKDAMEFRSSGAGPQGKSSSGESHGASSSAASSSSRTKSSKPFPSGTPRQPRQGGACFQCGHRTKHDFGQCSKSPDGRAAHSKRNATDATVATTAPMELTSVPSAAAPPMAAKLVPSPSPLKAEGFDKFIKMFDLQHAFPTMVSNIENGFDFGIPPIRETAIQKNHCIAEDELVILHEIVQKEMNAGRLLGPFNQEEVEAMLGPFQTSPLGLAPKPGGKWRMIQDFSSPRKGAVAAINDYIDSDEFICCWDGYLAMVDEIRGLPKGSLAAMSDAMEAFRAIAAMLSQRPGLVIALPLGGFGIDTRLPFGLASATGVWGSVADLVKIALSRIFPGIKTIKWVDDFIFLKKANDPITLDQVHDATKDLGFPWHPTKRSEFATTVKYLGFIWNLEAHTVTLPDDKREHFAEVAKRFTTSEPRSLKEVRELAGSLQHVAMMARDLAPFTAEIIAFMSAWNRYPPFKKLHVPPAIQVEAKKWVKALRGEMIRSIASPPSTFPHDIYVDASTSWGIGVTSGSRWAAWMLLAGWDKDSRGIGWAEAAALELGVRQAVAMGARNCRINVFSDNKGVIGAFRRGRSRGRQANSIMRSLIAFEMQHRLDVRVTYVSTHENPADAPSRGEFPPGDLLPPFDIPAPLQAFIHVIRIDHVV